MRAFLARLLDLGFLEFDVLARDGIVFLEDELFRLGARVLLGHVEIARIRRGQELDLDHGGLGHRSFRLSEKRNRPGRWARRERIGAQHTCGASDVKKARGLRQRVNERPTAVGRTTAKNSHNFIAQSKRGAAHVPNDSRVIVRQYSGEDKYLLNGL
jgi:hypothetical protein